MKPPKFHVGQAVVCIKGASWDVVVRGSIDGPNPVRGTIYKVLEISAWAGEWWIELVGFHHSDYSEEAFAPVELLPDEALAQLLEETLAEPVTV